jgi:hypothetical protein
MFTLAEVAAAFVGFSLVGSILRTTAGSERFLMMRDVAQVSLVAVAGSLAPYVVFLFDVEGDSLWRAASGALLLAWIVGGATAQRRHGLTNVTRRAPRLFVFGSLAHLAGVGLLIWSVFLGGSLTGARYMLALLILLTMAGSMFIWATFQAPSDPADD